MNYILHILSSLLPVCVVIRCLWMVLEPSVLYVTGICQRKLYKKRERQFKNVNIQE